MNKIIKTVVIFIAVVIVFSGFLGVFFLNHDFFDMCLEFIIYIIGYGDTDANAVVKLVFAIIGILLVGIFSSYITVIFIEQKSKLKINKNIYVDTSNNKRAYITIKTKQWELYDIEAKIIYSLNGSTYNETIGRYPYWKGNKKLDIDISLECGSALYWYLRALYEGIATEDIIIKIDFTNGKNNQSYSAIKKYSPTDNFVVNNEKRLPSHNELRELCDVNVALKSLNCINAEYIDYEAVLPPLDICESFSDGICAHVDLSNADNGNFGMLMLSEPFGGNWEFFKNEGYSLTFKIFCTTDMDLNLEIKSRLDDKMVDMKLNAYNQIESVTVDLTNIKTESLQNVRELCFTVFATDKKAKKGDIYIFDSCMLKEKTDDGVDVFIKSRN